MASSKDQSMAINNPGSGLIIASLQIAYIALAPATSLIAQEGGYTQQLITAMLNLVPGFGNLPTQRTIPALAAIYIFFTFVATANIARGAQEATAKEQDNNYPRLQQSQLRGLPLRLLSANQNLSENFPAFALCAALVQAIDPTNQHLVNLLGLFVLTKTFVYYPAYAMNVAPVRSLSHLASISSLLQVGWLLVQQGGGK